MLLSILRWFVIVVWSWLNEMLCWFCCPLIFFGWGVLFCVLWVYGCFMFSRWRFRRLLASEVEEYLRCECDKRVGCVLCVVECGGCVEGVVFRGVGG